MGFFQDVEKEARNQNLRFLVIGGLAVVFHGYTRDTADLDLLVRTGDKDRWLALFGRMGYKTIAERTNFVQLDPPAEGAWHVDLMLVKDESFVPMFEAAQPVEMYGAQLRIPSLNHLLALKLHALKNGHIERFSKDLLDVESLVRINAVDMSSEKVRQIFLKYGTLKLYEQISRFTSGEQSRD
jgi:predicted nucleotidyltransferase